MSDLFAAEEESVNLGSYLAVEAVVDKEQLVESNSWVGLRG
jgi:hypothetical protein